MLSDAVTVCLITGSRTASPDRIWTGVILKGIYLVGALEEGTDSFVPVLDKQEANDITQWYKDTDWLGDAVEWNGEPETQMTFTAKERSIPIVLRRLISRTDGEIDLAKLNSYPCPFGATAKRGS
jgi:hypothetical protein